MLERTHLKHDTAPVDNAEAIKPLIIPRKPVSSDFCLTLNLWIFKPENGICYVGRLSTDINFVQF